MIASWLNDPSVRPYEEIRFVAVGIAVAAPGQQMHAALLYRDANDVIRAIHYCRHHVWENEIASLASLDYFWTQPSIDDPRAELLAEFCEVVAEKRALSDVPFAFRHDESTVFDRSTGRLLGSDGQGLTCATFVLSMFASIGARLVTDYEWPGRACDRIWQERIVRWLEKSDAEYAKRLSGEMGVARYRPEEVVAAAAEQRRPVAFARALQGGREVLERMGQMSLVCWYDQDVLCPYD